MAHLADRLRLWFRVHADLLATLTQVPQFSTRNKNTDVFPLSFLNFIFPNKKNVEKLLSNTLESIGAYSEFSTLPQKKDI